MVLLPKHSLSHRYYLRQLSFEENFPSEQQLLNNLRQSGLLHTCILVTHRPESARFCSRTYEIRHRRVTEVTDDA